MSEHYEIMAEIDEFMKLKEAIDAKHTIAKLFIVLKVAQKMKIYPRLK